MNERDYWALAIHRERVFLAENFEQFKKAQLLFLDWILACDKDQKAAIADADSNFMVDPK